MTKQEFCPRPGWRGVTQWIALRMQTTVPQEAEIATQVGACASRAGDATYLINAGGTAWTIDTAAPVEHFYNSNAPALLLPLREQGGAADILGPAEQALISADPTTLSWRINVPMTVVTSTVGQMTDQYEKNDFTADALERWKTAATRKRMPTQAGSPHKMLAVCANSAYLTARLKWEPKRDIEATVRDVTSGLTAGANATTCLSAAAEFDEGRRVQLGLQPRVSPLLRSSTFEVAGTRLSMAQNAAKLFGAVLKVRFG